MLESREKRATQDKWLALAQAGMALMSSKSPTFGGALGEAGEAGLGALREGQSSSEADRLALLGQLEQSRMGREKMALDRQALAARAASGGARNPPAGLVSGLFKQLEEAQGALTQYGSPPKPGWIFDTPDPYAVERSAAAQNIARLQAQINSLYIPYGLQPFGGGSAGVFNASD